MSNDQIETVQLAHGPAFDEVAAMQMRAALLAAVREQPVRTDFGWICEILDEIAQTLWGLPSDLWRRMCTRGDLLVCEPGSTPIDRLALATAAQIYDLVGVLFDRPFASAYLAVRFGLGLQLVGRHARAFVANAYGERRAAELFAFTRAARRNEGCEPSPLVLLSDAAREASADVADATAQDAGADQGTATANDLNSIVRNAALWRWCLAELQTRSDLAATRPAEEGEPAPVPDAGSPA